MRCAEPPIDPRRKVVLGPEPQTGFALVAHIRGDAGIAAPYGSRAEKQIHFSSPTSVAHLHEFAVPVRERQVHLYTDLGPDVAPHAAVRR